MANNLTLKDAQAYVEYNIEKSIVSLLPSPSSELSNLLFEAMNYSCLGGGKRVRPFLLWAVGKLFNAREELLFKAGVAIEIVHCYSLIHDDLPAMDDDKLRRGKPTTHIKFNEATAILAGDGLLTHSFTILSTMPENIAIKLINILSTNAMLMVEGQQMDIMAEQAQSLSNKDIEKIQSYKTGALFEASILMGAVIGGASLVEINQLKDLAKYIGLMFQIKDDMLDMYGNEAETGKKVRKDLSKNKKTLISNMQKKEVINEIENLTKLAKEKISYFKNNDIILELIDFIAIRNS